MCNRGYVVGSTCRWSCDATGWFTAGLWIDFIKGRERKNHYEDEKKVWHLRFRGQQNWGKLVEVYIIFLFSNSQLRKSGLVPGSFDVITYTYYGRFCMWRKFQWQVSRDSLGFFCMTTWCHDTGKAVAITISVRGTMERLGESKQCCCILIGCFFVFCFCFCFFCTSKVYMFVCMYCDK